MLMATSPRVLVVARLLAKDNVARIPMVLMMLVLFSRERFAKMERAAWVIKPAHEEISNPSLIRAMVIKRVTMLVQLVVSSAI